MTMELIVSIVLAGGLLGGVTNALLNIWNGDALKYKRSLNLATKAVVGGAVSVLFFADLLLFQKELSLITSLASFFTAWLVGYFAADVAESAFIILAAHRGKYR